MKKKKDFRLLIYTKNTLIKVKKKYFFRDVTFIQNYQIFLNLINMQ